MTSGCTTNANFTSGTNYSGLSFTQGSAGGTFWATAAANAQSGYFASSPTSASSHADTSQVGAPGQPTGATSVTQPGAVLITFTATSGVTPTSYTAMACTNSTMTTGCISGAITSGGTLTGLTQSVSYWLRITANPPTGYTSANSAVSSGSTVSSQQLNTPVITNALPSTTTVGQITIAFTGSSNAPVGQLYTATACTNVAMTSGCVTHTGYTSGSQFTGLIPGTSYYVTITAVASPGYIASVSTVTGPVLATVQLLAPPTPTLAYGSVPGSISVTATSSNAPVGQTYTAKACTNSGMTIGCVTNASFTSGTDLTGLTFTQGSPGIAYYVQVTANASTGYLASGASPVAGPQTDTSQILPPGTPTVASSTTTAGAITATFVASGGPSLASYTATACTNTTMTTGCVSLANYTSGAQLTGLVPATSYYVTITALSLSAAYGPATSARSITSALATSQLNAPQITAVAPSLTTAGAITIAFNGSSNAPGGQTYTAMACTNIAMTIGCASVLSYTSGTQLTGLTAGTNYYVTLTAPGSTGYLAVTTVVTGPALATVQLSAPSGVTLAYGTVAGSVKVTFTGSANAPGGQLYTGKACTNSTMTTGCVTATVASGGNLTGLAYSAGSPGTSYYVTVTGAASSGYLVSAASPVAGPQAATSVLNTPTGYSAAPSTTTAGAITASFGAPSGTAPSSYTATVCTNAAMTAGCVSVPSYTTGAQITGLTPGTGYYVTVTAISSTGAYASSTTAVAGPTLATTQLTAPSGVSLAYGTAAGSIAVTFSGSSNAPGGQLYSAKGCTNAAMTTGCVTGIVASGGNLTGLVFTAGSPGTAYYVTVAASASTGYLASAPSGVAGPQVSTSQVGAPGTPSVTSSPTTAGAILATFTSSTGAAPTSYSATACTNAAMTTGCVTQASFTSGSSITGLTQGASYFVRITALPPAGYAANTSATSAASALATTQLTMPIVNSIAPSATTVGQITIVYTGSSNAPAGQVYTALACTDVAMTQNCVAHLGYVSGTQFTGLIVGTQYYVTITAVGSTGYLGATTLSVGPVLATVQLNAPGVVTLAYGATAGSLNIGFAPSSNAPGGQTYYVAACTNAAMTTGCVVNSNFLSSTDMTTLTFTLGSPGTNYYVTVTANASAGYLAGTSAVAGPHPATSQLNTPGTPTVTPSATTPGAVTVSFGAPAGQAPASYTVIVCTNAAMTTGCVSQPNYVVGTAITGLTQGASYWAQVIALPPVGFVGSVSAVSSAPGVATSQLTAPTAVSVAYGTAAGSIKVTFTGSSNAATGQTYTATACTDVAMTTGCLSGAITSGGNLTGLVFAAGSPGSTYYLTVAANASTGYLASAPSAIAGPQAATSQLAAPGTPSIASSTTTAGAVTATFTASSGQAPTSYSVTVCTNAAMTTGCVTQGSFVSGSQVTGLTAGSSYYGRVTAVPPAGFVSASSGVSASSALATTQLTVPTITTVAPSTTTAGAITIGFTGSSNAPGGQSYTATACTDAAMSLGCVVQAGYASGSQFTGLVAGTSYYVTISAVASSGYLAATSTVAGPSMSAIQLATPTAVSLSYGTVAGSIKITFTGSSNAPVGQIYSGTACTNAAMTTGCVSVGSLTSGANLTGLAYAAGSPGTSYYVTVSAAASSGYLAATTAAVGPQAAMSQLSSPGAPSVASSSTTAGAVTVTFAAPSGTAPASYTVTVCTNAAMTSGCTSVASYTSGGQVPGLTQGTAYYAQVAAVPPAGYLASTSTVSASSAIATTQLAAPTGVSLAYGTAAGSIKVTFTGSSNAPSGQTYTATACTNAAMTTGCVAIGTFSSGSNLTGLAYVAGSPGTAYYVTVTANASAGYLAATTPAAGPQAATSQLATPGTPTVSSSTTTAGAITASFAGSSGQAPASYTAIACTNAAMTTGCVTVPSYASGAQLIGLTQGTGYYVTITAVSGSAAFTSASTAAVGPALASTQLTAPTGLTLAYGTVAGSIKVTFTGSSNAPGGETYTATACTNAAMTLGCVTGAIASGGNLTGLAYISGSPGTAYYVTVTANASAGYLQATTAAAGPQNAISQLTTPGTPTVAPSSTTSGAITATFTSSSGQAPTSYTATACTNAAMTTGCVTQASYASGAQLTGLVAGTSYYVTITAVPPAGFLAATSSVSASAAMATVQLAAPVITAVAPSTTTPGQLTITYTGSSNAPGGQSYTATLCTDAAMTTGCTTRTSYASGSQVTGLTAGATYYVTIAAVGSAGYLAVTSVAAGPTLATVQLAAPNITAVAPSASTAGAVTVTFTGSSNAPGGQGYTATACTNAAMTTGCATQASYTSGAQLTGLTAGTTYYVTVTAVASTGYLAATSSAIGPTPATTQLAAPTGVSLAYGTVAGSVKVTFTGSSNAPGGQTYTAMACTNAAMTTGCVSAPGVTSGANLTGLAYALGSAGTSYFVTVSADPSTGYLSGTSSVAGSQAATSQLNAPTVSAVSPSTTTAGALTITFSAGAGTAPASYTAKACTNVGMTTGCVTQAGYTSGAQLTGLTAGTTYYVTVTAVPSSGAYLAAITASVGPTLATLQLTTPSTPVLAYGTAAGSLSVTTSSSNAPGGQTYTVKACTNAAMTTGCVTNSSYTPGTDLTGLAYSAGSVGTSYWVTAAANASSGYLASGTSSVAGPQVDTSKLNSPGTPSAASSTTTAGAITATFTAPSGQAPTSYSATACTNAAMTTGCVTQNAYTSGAQLTGLTQGTSYWLQITANPPAGYASSTSATSSSSAIATLQLATPSTPVLAYGSVAGSLTVTTSSSNAPGGQTYTVKACTNAAMTTGCVTNSSYTPGTDLTGLAFTQGSAGTPYYVTALANGATGYLASGTSAAGGPQPDTSKVNAPGTPSVATSAVHDAAVTVTFSSSSGVAPASYTVTVCTDAAMTLGCVAQGSFTSGSDVTGLVPGSSYYARVTAVGAAGYTSTNSSVSASAALAVVHLAAPSISSVSAGASSNKGALAITFTGSANAAPGQTYTAMVCTDAAMTQNCVTSSNYTSDTFVTGLTRNVAYYATITADPSTGYLSATSAAVGPTTTH
jgi:hypothetical protein